MHTTLEGTIERFFLYCNLHDRRANHGFGVGNTAQEIREQLSNLIEPLHSLTIYKEQLNTCTDLLTENFEDRLQASVQIEDRFHNSGITRYREPATDCTDCNGVTIYIGDKVRAELEPKVWELAIVVQLGPNNCVYITPRKSGRTYCKLAYQVEVWD